jgi:hypothetical protein
MKQKTDAGVYVRSDRHYFKCNEDNKRNVTVETHESMTSGNWKMNGKFKPHIHVGKVAADDTRPVFAEVRNAWSYTTIFPYVFMALHFADKIL